MDSLTQGSTAGVAARAAAGAASDGAASAAVCTSSWTHRGALRPIGGREDHPQESFVIAA